jgi:hypothetical protein
MLRPRGRASHRPRGMICAISTRPRGRASATHVCRSRVRDLYDRIRWRPERRTPSSRCRTSRCSTARYLVSHGRRRLSGRATGLGVRRERRTRHRSSAWSPICVSHSSGVWSWPARQQVASIHASGSRSTTLIPRRACRTTSSPWHLRSTGAPGRHRPGGVAPVRVVGGTWRRSGPRCRTTAVTSPGSRTAREASRVLPAGRGPDVPLLQVHDLRHVGNTLHATAERDRARTGQRWEQPH